MKKLLTIILLFTFIFILTPFIITSVTKAALSPYKTHVTKVEPSIPNFKIYGLSDVINITNNTGKDIYLYKANKRSAIDIGGDVLLPPTSVRTDEEIDKIREENKDKSYYRHFANTIQFYPVWPEGNITPDNPRKDWEIEGRVNGEKFTIYGYTEYYIYKNEPIISLQYFFLIMALISIIIMILGLLKWVIKKEKDKGLRIIKIGVFLFLISSCLWVISVFTTG